MAAVTMTPEDLNPFLDTPIPVERAILMIEDAIAIAATVAPCILTDEFVKTSAARAIIRAAILRWHQTGSGGLQTVSVGQLSQTFDNRQQRRGMFWPSEIEQLQDLCRESTAAVGAFVVDTVSATGGGHADICSLNFGATYCSCGAVLTNSLYPLYEQS